MPRKLEPSTAGNCAGVTRNDLTRTVPRTPARKTSKTSKNSPRPTTIVSRQCARVSGAWSRASAAVTVRTLRHNQPGAIPFVPERLRRHVDGHAGDRVTRVERGMLLTDPHRTDDGRLSSLRRAC